jgi:hypothetical protein
VFPSTSDGQVPVDRSPFAETAIPVRGSKLACILRRPPHRVVFGAGRGYIKSLLFLARVACRGLPAAILWNEMEWRRDGMTRRKRSTR